LLTEFAAKNLGFVKIVSQNPTASLTGGNNYELHGAGTFTATLNWSAGRSASGTNIAATYPISSITVAGISRSTSGCSSPPCNITGTQSVTVTYNTNVTFNNSVATTDGKSASASTSFNFLPNVYWGYSSSLTPDSATVLAKAGGGQNLQYSRGYAPTVTVPSGAAKYVYYAYPSNESALTGIHDGAGNSVIGAFTQSTLTFTNASGYMQQYYIYTSNNNYSNTTVYVNYQ
jgi:hypothetical protein